MLKNILILGHKSYVATGIAGKLEAESFNVTCFSRGKTERTGNIVSGDVCQLVSNQYFDECYDVVINFILLKNESIEKNLEYIKELIVFCKLKKVKRLIHISSISVYPNEATIVDATSPIETDITGKGIYSSQKIAIDKYLLEQKDLSFELVFVRPGFVVSDEIKSPLAGIAIKLPLNFCLLLGDRNTTLPIIKRDRLQNALIEIVGKSQVKSVYLLLKNDKGTKYSYIKEQFGYKIITLPKPLVLFAAKTLNYLKIFNSAKYQQVKGLFKSTYFDSSETERELNIKF